MTMVVSHDQRFGAGRWAEAIAAIAVVSTVILSARQLRPLVEVAAFSRAGNSAWIVLPQSASFRACFWVAIGVAVLLRGRVAARLAAWAAVLFEIVMVAMRVTGDAAYALPLDLVIWPLLLALTAALLLSVPAERHGVDVIGRRGRWLLAAAAMVTTVSAAAIPLLGVYGPGLSPTSPLAGYAGWMVAFSIPTNLANGVRLAPVAVVAALALAAFTAAEPAVRRRLFPLVGAGLAAFVAIQLGLPQPFGVSGLLGLARPAQITLLVLGPALVIGLGLLWIRLREKPTGGERTQEKVA